MPPARLDTPVQYLKGVGPKLAKVLKKVGVETIEDLIYYFPRDHEDRTKLIPLGKIQPAGHIVARGEVVKVNHQLTRNRFSILKLLISDRTGSIQAVWFNQPYLLKLLRPGMKLIISGKVEHSEFDGKLQLQVRDFEIDTGVNPKIVPQYPLTEGLYPKKLKSIIMKALDDHLPEVSEWLPDGLRQKYKLLDLPEAIRLLHLPEKPSQVEPARRRLAFDDFFIFELGLGLRRSRVKKEKGVSFKIDEQALQKFKISLPFTLTKAQERVVSEILSDMAGPYPMNRLLQGDVGSGKTVVAALAALTAVSNGYQAAIMAPTEILAQQHYDKLTRMLPDLGIELLTSATARKRGLKPADIYVGTHALIQAKVSFDKLGLVVIDEQHRFGVMQRAGLVKKGASPDILVMTATPIPRSLALTLYGDLDRSVIDEMPPGRIAVKTHFVPEDKRGSAYEFMRQRIQEGRQIFIVCPLVEESEKIDLRAAMDEAGRLQEDIFPEFKVGLMHGRLKSEDKDRIMKDFKTGRIQILVSTTVIEVGIDVPNATVMVIEHAERFGLSQLHQLRGRIGRGDRQSYCFLIAETKSPEARARIKAMIDSSDGFKIAEVDLRLRGPGEFYGTRQSGLPNFRVADIIKDEKILRQAREAAFALIETDIASASNIWKSQGQKIKGPSTGSGLPALN